MGADGANFDYTKCDYASFSHANLGHTTFFGASLFRSNLSNAKLTGANLGSTNLIHAILANAKLVSTNLRKANLSNADLSNVNLSRAKLSNANLSNANLTSARLSRADIIRVNLSNANLSEADLQSAQVGWTQFDAVDLQTVRGLETIKHAGPSNISIDTLYLSRGHIPEVFLRKAGVPEDFLTYLPALMNRAFEYYTCFISYSSKDQEFVESLYANLQAKGVRCWYAQEDMKIGDNIRQRIDESIRVYDKLLLVLSEQSVASPWVEFEVEAALEKERRESRTVLFPIRLDDQVMQSQTAWAADIRRSRHIGDFTRWKDHDSYQKGLQRLMRDLQPERPTESKTSLP